ADPSKTGRCPPLGSWVPTGTQPEPRPPRGPPVPGGSSGRGVTDVSGGPLGSSSPGRLRPPSLLGPGEAGTRGQQPWSPGDEPGPSRQGGGALPPGAGDRSGVGKRVPHNHALPARTGSGPPQPRVPARFDGRVAPGGRVVPGRDRHPGE